MSESDRGSRRTGGVLGFAIKTFIVAAAIVFVTDWVIDSLQTAASRTVADLQTKIQGSTRIGGTKFWTKLEDTLDHAADESADLPPERKQQLIKDVRVIVARWRPFLDAVRSELDGPPADAQERAGGKSPLGAR